MTEDQKQFFNKLNQLDSGERAALRHSAGTMIHGADSGAIRAFFKCLPASVNRWQEEKWFAIACLRCLWKAGDEGTKRVEVGIAEALEHKSISPSVAHRVQTLLDTSWDIDGYMLGKMTRLIRLLRQKPECADLDFPALLDDLLYWDSNNQSVKRRWARAIFTKN